MIKADPSARSATPAAGTSSAHAASVSHKPKQLDVFGTKLVAYRGKEDDQVHVLDAYCPHMGGDLCGGEVKGNSVVCPFHLWSWGADGVCDDIPYAKKIPDKAVIKSWPVLEKEWPGLRLAGPGGQRPDPRAGTARAWRTGIPASGLTGRWRRFPSSSLGRELVDNMADMAHFGPDPLLHRQVLQATRMEGHVFVQYMVGGHEILTEGDGGLITSVATYEGPAYMTTTMTGA